jgi:hypothetical protein
MKFGTPTRSSASCELVGQASRLSTPPFRPSWLAPGRDTRRGLSAASAFTLAEVLAALVFMAIVIPVALWALSISTRVGEVAARKGEAALVAERILNESIVTTNWNRSVQTGTQRQGVREFPWTVRSDPWTQDPNVSTIRLVSVEVKYQVQGQEFAFNLATLADSAAPTATSTTR